MKHACYMVEIRSTDDDKRIIEGIANTGAVDSYNTILEPEGAEFKLPLPVLYQHNSKQPIGHVVEAKVSKNGIRVKLQLAPAGVAGFIDEAWSLIKAGLVRGLSVGFDPIEEVFDKTFNGFRFPKWRWLELSTVTIAANSDATMLAVRSADEAILAALGNKRDSFVVRLTLNPPGVSGQPKGNDPMKKTLQEQIADFGQKRSANQAQIDALMDKAAEESRSLDTAESETYETLKRENEALDTHIGRLQEQEKVALKRAARIEIPAGDVEPEKSGQDQRAGMVSSGVQLKRNDPKGIGMARAAIAMYHANGSRFLAEQFAKKRWPDHTEVTAIINYQSRTAVEAGDSTTSGWASQLISGQVNADFLEMLRAASIIGRVVGFRRVPFNVAVPVQSGAGTYGWVGEAAGKPVTSLTFTNVTLRWSKCAGIIVITDELARYSTPSAEVIIRDEMLKGLANFYDAQFVSSTAAVSNVSPAGILNGVSATSTTGTAASNFRTDMNNMLNNFTANNQSISGLTILMSETQALALSLMVTDLGVPLFPQITSTGGTVLGRPVVTSEAIGTKIIALIPNQILFAEDDGIQIDVSREASVEMETTPAIGETSPLTTVSNIKSFWQNNLVGFRAERYITWVKGRTSAVEYIDSVAYVP